RALYRGLGSRLRRREAKLPPLRTNRADLDQIESAGGRVRLSQPRKVEEAPGFAPSFQHEERRQRCSGLVGKDRRRGEQAEGSDRPTRERASQAKGSAGQGQAREPKPRSSYYPGRMF